MFFDIVAQNSFGVSKSFLSNVSANIIKNVSYASAELLRERMAFER